MFESPQIIQSGNSYRVQHGTDAGLYVEFYLEAVKDEEATIEAGRPIFFDREYIKIIPVGDKMTVICEPVTDEYRFRWPQKYAAFKAQQHQPQEGTPLEQWPPLTKSQVLTFKGANVHTVEQLANVSDGNLSNLGMGARDLREKAIAYIKSAEGSAGVLAMQQQLNDAMKQIEALKNQLSGFKEEGIGVEPKKRGPKPKIKEVDNGENAA